MTGFAPQRPLILRGLNRARNLNSSSSIGRNRTVARSFIERTGMVSGNGNGHDEKIIGKPRRTPAFPSAFPSAFHHLLVPPRLAAGASPFAAYQCWTAHRKNTPHGA